MSESIKISVSKTIEGRICYRLLAMASFIKQNGEWGFMECNHRFLSQAFKYAQNMGNNLERQILSAYKEESRDVLKMHLEEDQIKDISLVIDELIDAENIDELLELIKANKK